MAAAKEVVATTNFACIVDGVEQFVHAGDAFPSGHVVVKARAELFEPVAEPPPAKRQTAKK